MTMRMLRWAAIAALLVFAAGLCGPWCRPAYAHRVSVFAWVNGDMVETESGFSRGNPVVQGTITAFDAVSGDQLAQGVTDAEGRYAFPVPAAIRGSGHGLRIRVDAGEGHRSEWILDAGDIPGSSGEGRTLQAEATPPSGKGYPSPGKGTPSPETPSPSASMPSPPSGMAPPPSGTTPSELRTILSSVLDEKLAPIRRSLALLERPEPGLRDIVGGIGWIVGIAGIVLYFRGRRR
ncbi:MAG: cobalamin biosynthesis protein CbiL [Desulfovibrio sp.]|jgi:nickel transport protein|nr:cobalamin biosynthesis protein CbiL [Desulfovibrio sp.]